jgi:hypothetical protein
MQASLAKLVLKRFLLLTALLDKALSAASLPSGAPLLFRKDSQLKASAQVRCEAYVADGRGCKLAALLLPLLADVLYVVNAPSHFQQGRRLLLRALSAGSG